MKSTGLGWRCVLEKIGEWKENRGGGRGGEITLNAPN